MKQKYRLTDETIEYGGVTLYRIEALREFGNVRAGDKGGFVQSELNLSQEGDCWIYGKARVFGEAWVFGEARVFGEAWVFGEARVFDKAEVFGDVEVYGDAMIADIAKVCGDVRIYGNAEIFGDAIIKSIRDYIVFKNWWSSGRYFTWTRNNNMWKVGCFYGTGEELITKAFLDSRESGIAYRRVVRYVNSILTNK
jgi:predicted acyltransferase (DUF342 family)